MELTKRCKDYWGFSPHTNPFGTHIEADDGLFVWPAFDEAADRIAYAVRRRLFLVVSGVACSAKSTAWAEARRRLARDDRSPHICQPLGLDPARYRDQTVYHAVKHTIEPPDGSRETSFRRFREDRAAQCRELLQRANASGRPVVVAINDAHACGMDFLRLCKRLWDDLAGFDRLCGILLIGHPSLVSKIGGCPEINERTEVLRMPGLVEMTPAGKIADNHIEAYLHHEMARCGAAEFPFDESAIAQLTRLARPNWVETRDHPLVINNLVSSALDAAWRIKARTINGDLIASAMRAEQA